MELVIRATVVYWFLWLVIRGTGKRSLSELSPLELVILVVLGDLVQQGVTQKDASVTGAVIVISTFVGWMIVADLVTRHSHSADRVLSGRPVIVVRDGEPLMDRLSEERMALDDLLGAARAQGFANLDEISFGVLEDDGKFSFVAKAAKRSQGAPDSVAE
ncbi:MAG: YetF domain-containing protein [Microthrixaceae bacterium]